jgi:hypothetical protein
MIAINRTPPIFPSPKRLTSPSYPIFGATCNVTNLRPIPGTSDPSEQGR